MELHTKVQRCRKDINEDLKKQMLEKRLSYLVLKGEGNLTDSELKEIDSILDDINKIIEEILFVHGLEKSDLEKVV